MANIKFSQFTEKTTLGTIDFLVGYTGAENVQISPTNLLSTFASGSGTTGFIPKWTSSSNLGDSILEVNSALPSDVLMPQYIRHSGDTNTYFGFYSNDTFIVSTSGNEVMRVNSSGNVGIGTSSPVSKLDVIGGVVAQGTLVATGISQLGSSGVNVYLTSSSAGNVGIGTSSPTFKLDVEADSSSGVVSVKNAANGRDTFRSENAAGTRTLNFGNDGSGNGLLLIRNSSGGVTNYIAGNGDSYFTGGNVGIGTTSPGQKLEVVGNIKADSTGNTQVILESGGSCAMDLLNAQTEAYLRTTTAHDLHFRTTNINRMVVKAGGNVGIGTISPTKALQVNGEALFGNGTDGLLLSYSGTNSSGIIDTGHSSTALEFRVGNTQELLINGTSATFAGAVDVNGNLAVEDEIHLTDGGSTVRGKLLLNSSDRDNVELRAESLGSTIKFFTVGTQALLLDASQNATFAGRVMSDTHFQSSDTNATLSATGTGNVYLRPNGYSNSTGQVHINTSGNATFAGNVTLSNTLPLLYLTNTTGGTGKNWRLSSATNGKFFISEEGVVDAVTFDHTSGNATFAGSVKADGNIALGNISGVARLQHEGSGQLKMLSSGDSAIGTFTSTGTTFPSDIETTSSSKGLILKSPDGTRYRVTVANGGTLSVSAV